MMSDQDGVLEEDTSESDLRWDDSDTEHTFYGWTLPWMGENINSELKIEGADIPELQISFDQNNEMYERQEDKQNCATLERFIGAKTEALTYRDNGQYVSLEFRHLVSRIEISHIEIMLGENRETSSRINGTITFNLPDKAVFYPIGKDGNSFPKVIGEKEVDSSVTYTITPTQGSNGNNNIFYVCPEMDMSDVEFTIHVETAQFGSAGNWTTKDIKEDYKGSFSNVSFNRSENEKWDMDELGNIKSEKKLYAAERMSMRLTLKDGNYTGISVNITPWNDNPASTSDTHYRNGIYSGDDFNQYLTMTSDERAEIFTEDGEVNLFEDITISGDKIPTDDGTVFDGLGHTITVSRSSSEITVGNVRDVYITNGNNTIYIDSEGYLYTQNPDGTFKKSEYKLNENGDNSINLRNGIIS